MYRPYSFKESDFQKKLAQFNAILGPTPFEATRANKKHDDAYGLEIRVNDIYYRRDYGGYSNVIKLSRRSMEDLLHAVMWGNHYLQDLGDFFIEQQQQRMREAARAVSKRRTAEPDTSDSTPSICDTEAAPSGDEM